MRKLIVFVIAMGLAAFAFAEKHDLQINSCIKNKVHVLVYDGADGLLIAPVTSEWLSYKGESNNLYCHERGCTISVHWFIKGGTAWKNFHNMPAGSYTILPYGEGVMLYSPKRSCS